MILQALAEKRVRRRKSEMGLIDVGVTAQWQAETFQPYLERLKRGLDISTYDDVYLAKMKEKYGVKMTGEDSLFRDDQISHTRKMYCQSFADKQWLATFGALIPYFLQLLQNN